MKRSKLTMFWAMLVAINLLAVEVLSALLLFHYYSFAGYGTPAFSYADGRLATTVLLRKSLGKLYDPLDQRVVETKISSIPSPFFTRDETLGYRVAPGRYDVIVEQPRGKYKWRVSIDEDGGRAVNASGAAGPRQAHFFGDSFFFGSGLNDPHVFTWLLQSQFPDRRVHNHAMAGYGNLHNYLQLRQIRERIGPDDVLIFAYGDYFNERNSAAPSRVKETFDYSAQGQAVASHAYLHPYAMVEDGELLIRRVSGDCRANDGWCERADPSQAEMLNVTSRIFDHILDSTPATVAVALLRGDLDDPVLVRLREKRVPIIDLRPSGEFFEMDDPGFDGHPGPVAHYYYAEKIARYLREIGF